MKTQQSINAQGRFLRQHAGTTLLEVLLAIVVFAVGMMALIKLQGNLARSSTDANQRTVAASVAEEIIEDLRAFQRLSIDPDNPAVAAYAGIVDTDPPLTRTRGNVVYTVDIEVTDQYFMPDGQTVTDAVSDLPAGRDTTFSDFKVLELTVNWGALPFQVDNKGAENTLGSGSITLSSIIPSLSGLGSAQIAANDDGLPGTPPVAYTPGLLPDIVAISLGDSKFKESTTPEPDVIRRDELVESWWDVVTYSQDQSLNANFLRREEFLAVSCDCELRAATTGAQGGLRPTVWEGTEYSAAEFVQKPFGVSASNQNSQFCDICCRDHHDGGSSDGLNQYNPWRASGDYHTGGGSFAGDHKHYGRDNKGELTLADKNGDDYVEACRMVRKDGFMRVAHDLRQQALYGFPADYLDESAEADEYSAYVTAAAMAYVDEVPTCTDAASCSDYSGPIPPNSEPEWPLVGDVSGPGIPGSFPASTPEAPTTLPTATGAATQQLRSRGNYIDFLSPKTREAIDCLNGSTTTPKGVECNLPGISSVLEVIPFFDVQLTFLNRWSVADALGSVAVSNDPVADGNSHSRGVARKRANGPFGVSDVIIGSHSGNLGLTATDPIDLDYNSELAFYDVYVDVPDPAGGDPGDPDDPGPPGITASGSFLTNVNGFKVANVAVAGVNALCQRPTDVEWSCTIQNPALPATLTLSNLTKGGSSYYACTSSSDVSVVSSGPGTAIYTLPTAASINGITFTIQAAICP